jgi:hypothetical protein
MCLLPGDINGPKGRFFALKQAQSLVKVFQPALVSASQSRRRNSSQSNIGNKSEGKTHLIKLSQEVQVAPSGLP